MSPDAYLEMASTEASHWWFVGRRKVLESVLAGLALPPKARILEIGCGTGGNLSMLASFGQVSALETDGAARSIAKQRAGDHVDIRAGRCPEDISFAGEAFHLICLLDVLEHIEQDVATLLAARELLAPNGRILLTVPAYRWLWSVHDEFLHHKRRYSAGELRLKVLSARLKLERMSYFNTFLFPLLALARIKDRLTGSSSASGTAIPPAPLNLLLARVFGAERFALRATNFPFGASLLAIVRVE